MTLLSISKSVADSVGLPRPTSVGSSVGELERQMLALANMVLKDLRRVDWPVLERSATIPLVVGLSEYDLEDDFERMIGDSAYNSSSYYAIRNQLTATEWQRQQYSGLSGTGRFKIRILGYPAAINIVPTPQVTDTVVYEYITKSTVLAVDGVTFKELYALDDDTAILPEEVVELGLKWRIKHAKGLDYTEDYNEYEGVKRQLMAQRSGLETLPVALRNYCDTGELTNGYVPENGFG